MNREPQTLTAAYARARSHGRTATDALATARDNLNQYRDARAAYSGAAAQRDANPSDAAESLVTRTRAQAARARLTVCPPAPDYGAGTWQGVDANGFRVMNGGPSGGLFSAHDDTAAGVFRYTQDAPDVVTLDHTGWYANPHGESFKDGSGLCLGVVARLAGGGPARFVAGYRFGGHEDSGTFTMRTLYVATSGDEYDIEAASRDAARAAEELARIAGERESEYQTAWEAGQQWADLGEQITTARRDALAILAERRDAQAVFAKPDGFPTLCDAIRRQVTQYRDAIRDARDERAALAHGDDSTLGFWAGSERLQSAFCEGAGVANMPA